MELDVYIEQIIITYKTSNRMRILFALLLIFLGLTIILLNVLNVIVLPSDLKNLISIAGTLVSSICAFPIKEIVDRKNKIKLIKILSDKFENSKGADKKKLEELLWKFIEKNTID